MSAPHVSGRKEIYEAADALKKSTEVRMLELDPDTKPDVIEYKLRDFLQDIKQRLRSKKRVQMIAVTLR